MRPIAILCLISLVVLTGCSSLKDTIDKFLGVEEGDTAEELAWDGMDAYESGKYLKAIEKFQKIKDYYPFSKYAILAELKIADAHYQREEYEEAIFEYENFERLHPRNEAIPYVIYRTGRSYFNQIDTIDRDQSNATKALETYLRLIRQYPNDAYAGMAKSDMLACYQSLSGHEFYVGVFYYKNKNYQAAKSRFTAVVKKYPDVGYHHQALSYIANCEAWIWSRLVPPDMDMTSFQ